MRLVCWVTRLTWCKSCIGRGRVNLWVPGWRRLVLVGIDLRETLGRTVVVGETAQ